MATSHTELASLRRLANTRVGIDAGEDLLQDILVKHPEYSGRQLNVAIRNRAISYYRNVQREREVLSGFDGWTTPPAPPDGLEADLRLAIDKLQPDEKALFFDAFLAELTLAELAEKYQATLWEVRVRLRRVRDKLQDLLGWRGHHREDGVR